MGDKKHIFLYTFYSEQVDDICSFLEIIPGEYKERDLHQLRVRVKRIKAVFRFLQFINPSEFRAKDHYRLFKPVFKAAGLIRESQVNLKILENHKTGKALLKPFSKYITKLRPVWDENLGNAITSFNYTRLEEINALVGEMLSAYTEKELIKKIEEFIYSENSRIKQLLDDSTDDYEYIHDVRRILKNIKPLLKLTWRVEGSNFTESHFDSLNRTEKLIGNWHDKLVLAESVRLFYNAKGKKKDKFVDRYRSLQTKLKKENDSALDKISENLTLTLIKFTPGVKDAE